jgi:aminoglycoside/choline kinase family phosphotransferase
MSQVVTPEAMDANWFTERLAENGFPGETVRGVNRKQIGTGQIGACFRFELDLANEDSPAPRTFVGKFPSDDPISRATGVQLRNYYREVEFYRRLADRLNISIPKCYYDAIKGEGPEFVLLLEDMAPAEQGDQLGGCSVEVARAAVLELVGLQAPSWCDESLKQYDWLYTLQEPELTTQMLYSQLLPGFLERYGDRLEADERDIIARVGESPECPLFVPAETPFCLEHVDYRLDNMLIDATHSPPKVTVVDWQSLRLGPPMNDVAYFLGAGLLPEDRRGAEEDIVRDYHQALTGAGVEGYDWDACWTDYRKGSFSGFGVTVIASMIVQQTERGDEMFTVMARRHARHALDVGAEEFLG